MEAGVRSARKKVERPEHYWPFDLGPERRRRQGALSDSAYAAGGHKAPSAGAAEACLDDETSATA